MAASVESHEHGGAQEAAMNALNNIRPYLLACSLMVILQPFQGLAESNADASRASLQQSVEQHSGQSDRLRDGQHDFDFEIGTWRTHLSRLVHPLTGSTINFVFVFVFGGGGGGGGGGFCFVLFGSVIALMHVSRLPQCRLRPRAVPRSAWSIRITRGRETPPAGETGGIATSIELVVRAQEEQREVG